MKFVPQIDFDEAQNELKKYIELESDEEDYEAIPKGVYKHMFAHVDILLTKYKLYTMHTNFPITDDFINDICAVAGVEGYDPLSPYRGRIIFGQLFKAETVQSDIRKATKAKYEQEAQDAAQIVNRIIDELGFKLFHTNDLEQIYTEPPNETP